MTANEASTHTTIARLVKSLMFSIKCSLNHSLISVSSIDLCHHKVGISQTVSLILNAGLMLYAHLGLSGVIMTSLDPKTVVSESTVNNTADNCNENDEDIWTTNLGHSTLPQQSDFCIRSYGESGTGCLANATCIESCVKDVHGYSDDCAICFGAILPCGVINDCTFLCIADSTSAECLDCLVPCFEEFDVCSGLPQVGSTVTRRNSVTTSSATSGDSCNSFDLDAIESWHLVYNMTFVKGVRDTWNNDAKLLATLIVFFSGVWPYAKVRVFHQKTMESMSGSLKQNKFFCS